MRKNRAIESQHGAELSRVGRNDTAKKGWTAEGVNRKTTRRWLSIDARTTLSRNLRAPRNILQDARATEIWVSTLFFFLFSLPKFYFICLLVSACVCD